MANTPDSTRDIFNADKRYLGGKYQPKRQLYDWDVNETNDEMRWFLIKTADALAGGSGRIETAAGFSLQPVANDTDEIQISGGYAFIHGRLVKVDTSFSYDDSVVNYIVSGEISTITEISAGVTYTVTDAEKLLNSNYSLAGCRFIHIPSGTTFDITGLSGQQVEVSGDLSLVSPGDAYRVAPPALSAGGGTESFKLVSWFEDTSAIEDTELQDPISGKEPSHRLELRWCIHREWAGVSTEVALEGHSAVEVFVADLTAFPVIAAADVTDGEYVRSLAGQDIPTRMTAAEADIDVLEDKAEQLDRKDTEYDFAQEGYFSVEHDTSKTLVLVNGKSVSTPFLANKATNKYQATVAASIVDNAITESSHFRFMPNGAGDALEGDTFGSSLKQFDKNDVVIQDRQVNVLSLEATNSAPDPLIKRAFPMLDMPMKQGMDWSAVQDATGKFPLHVQPGQFTYGGKLYQNPDEFILDDIRDPAFHLNGAKPVDSWTYLYATTTAGLRSLGYAFDTAKPKWNGEHPSSQAMCLGFVYFGATDPIRCTCINDRMFLLDDFQVQVNSGGTSFWDILPPKGCGDLLIKGIGFSDNASASGIINCVPDVDINSSHSTPLSMGENVIAYTYVTVPGNMSVYNSLVVVGGGTASVTLQVQNLSIRFGYTPDTTSWRD